MNRTRMSAVGVIVSALICEGISTVWFMDGMPWKAAEQRIFMSALIADLILALLVDYAIRYHWGVANWQDCTRIGVFVALVYASLLAPYIPVVKEAFITLFFKTLHKFVLVTAMAFIQNEVSRQGY